MGTIYWVVIVLVIAYVTFRLTAGPPPGSTRGAK